MKLIKSFLVLLFLLCIAGGVGYYVYSDPKTSMKFKVLMSKFGLSKIGQEEQDRLNQIDALDIPFEQRQSLKQRNIFIGATKTMVKLAFGDPKNLPKQLKKNQEIWVYYFDDYDRPLFLYFDANILVAAKRGSNADLAVVN